MNSLLFDVCGGHDGFRARLGSREATQMFEQQLRCRGVMNSKILRTKQSMRCYAMYEADGGLAMTVRMDV